MSTAEEPDMKFWRVKIAGTRSGAGVFLTGMFLAVSSDRFSKLACFKLFEDDRVTAITNLASLKNEKFLIKISQKNFFLFLSLSLLLTTRYITTSHYHTKPLRVIVL